MAAAVYTTDLSTFNDCTSNTGWVEMNGMSQGGGADLDTDLGIVSDRCISELIRKSGLASLAYNNGSGVTIPTDGGFFVWSKYQAANSIETRANRGVMVVIGSSTSVWGSFNMDGSDSYAYGGWVNYFVDPTLTPDNENGTYTTTYQYCGTGINVVSAVSKGNPQSIDFMRYGRGEARFTDGDLANGYATFAGFAALNDVATTARWGLIQEVKGGYLWKGLMSLGLTGTAVDMRDSNVAITIDDTIKASTSFNRIEIHNASSNIEWDSVNILKVGSISKGEFEMIDNATVALNTCNFTDMSTFIFQSNATITTVSFIRCGLVTQGGSTISDSKFDNATATASVLSTDLGLITDSTFISDGSNHAVELNTVGDGTMDWGNSLDGYVTGVAGSPASTGSTGNESIYVNVGSGTLTINVTAGASIPSIRSAGATVNVVAGQITTTIIANDISTGGLIQSARVAVEAFSGGSENYKESVTITNASTTATVTHTGHGLVTSNKVRISGADQNNYNGIKTITVTTANAYTYTTSGGPTSPATGTITSTTVFIDGLTDVNGEISDTRSLSSNQPIRGRVRRATTGTLYKTSPIVATINNVSGLNLSVQMIPDE